MQTRFQTALAFEKNNSKRVRYFNAALNSKKFFQTASAFLKNSTNGARYFNAAANGTDRQRCVRPPDGVGAQSLRCLLPIFDPDGVGQNPLDFFL